LIRLCFIAIQEPHTNHFGYGGLNASASSLDGNGGNLTLKYKAKRYFSVTKGGTSMLEFFLKVLPLMF
jgi:hypothetical protein